MTHMEIMVEKTGEFARLVDELSSKIEGKVVVSLDDVNWEEAGRELQWAVLLKLASGRTFIKTALVGVLENIWRLKQPAEYLKVEKNILLVKFKNREDQEKVLDGGPWTFEGNAIVLQRWEPGMTGEDFSNSKINIWVHIHRLPFELRNDTYAKKFAEYAGKVRQPNKNVGNKVSPFGGEYMKCRIELDTSKPILPGLFLRRADRKTAWILMKYVKMPNVCYNCGKMNHDQRLCKERKATGDTMFEGWLKAEEQSKYVPAWSEKNSEEYFLVVPPPTAREERNMNDQEDKETQSVEDEGMVIEKDGSRNVLLENGNETLNMQNGVKEGAEAAALEKEQRMKDMDTVLARNELDLAQKIGPHFPTRLVTTVGCRGGE